MRFSRRRARETWRRPISTHNFESLHTRFLGEKAQTSKMVERRRAASAAYDHYISDEELDTHHHLELLAETLDVELPPAT